MTTDPPNIPPSAIRSLSRVAVPLIAGLAVALLFAITLQSRWNQAASAANLELATLQIAALETALESETVLSSETSANLRASLNGSGISARALLFRQSSGNADSPTAVVIWNDTTNSGRLIFVADTGFATAFSNMSGHVLISGQNTTLPLSFVSTGTSEVVNIQTTERVGVALQINLKFIPHDVQDSVTHWVGTFER